ncbi:hypothetical protein [Methylobacterium sp. CM6257]|jgi:hypothetical protein
MPDVLTPPMVALGLTITFVITAGAVGIRRTRHDPSRRTELLIILTVLTLTMAASVALFQPLRAGDLIDARPQP